MAFTISSIINDNDGSSPAPTARTNLELVKDMQLGIDSSKLDDTTTGTTTQSCEDTRPQRASLLGLPAELRLRIYELVLWPQVLPKVVQEYRYYLRKSCQYEACTDHCSSPDLWYTYTINLENNDVWEDLGTYKPPRLLSVNRLVRREASELFYSKTIFSRLLRLDRIAYPTILQFWKWTECLTPQDRRLVKTFRLRTAHHDLFSNFHTCKSRTARGVVTTLGWPMSEEEKAILHLNMRDFRPDYPAESRAWLSFAEIEATEDDDWYVRSPHSVFQDLPDGWEDEHKWFQTEIFGKDD